MVVFSSKWQIKLSEWEHETANIFGFFYQHRNIYEWLKYYVAMCKLFFSCVYLRYMVMRMEIPVAQRINLELYDYVALW